MSQNYNEIIEMEILSGIDKLFHTILSMEVPPDCAYRYCLRNANYLKDKLPKYIDNILSGIDDEYKISYAKWKEEHKRQLEEKGKDFDAEYPDLKE